MDTEIQFGDLEESGPDSQLRPDQNRHYAVVACGCPEDAELPIYVDLDCLRDMEEHARSDTTVELGGVMLGGQYVGDDGRPFVVVSDNIRAAHYEATKGSFKFTHDTWSQISRERDGFTEEHQLVGWYHTHPDWGVFLSGMDMFICDNFFNKPLDVALVIDPCRQDRGFFQWTGDETERVRRVAGFYLIGSRFREAELQYYASLFEASPEMAQMTNSGGFSPAPFAAPVVNVSGSQSPWQAVAVLGMLTMQFVFLALIAWKMLAEPPAEPAAPAGVAQAAATNGDLQAQRELLDQVVEQLGAEPAGLVQSLEEKRRENEQLQAATLGLQTRVRDLAELNLRAETRTKDLNGRLAQLQARFAQLEEDNARQANELEELQQRLTSYESPLSGTVKKWWQVVDVKWLTLAAIIVALAAGGIAIGLRKRPEFEQPEEAGAEPPADFGE